MRRSDLSPDQRTVYDSMLDWVNSGGRGQSVLSVGGHAGTGKSTLLALFAAETNLRIAYVSFTGRASSILGRKLRAGGVQTTDRMQSDNERLLTGRWGHRFYSPGSIEASRPFCGTIHRLILRPLINFETEVLYGWEDRQALDRRYDLIVIDECFDYAQPVLTEDGWQYIGSLVNNEIQCRVWAYNRATRKLELKPIVRWLRKPSPNQLLRIDAGRTDSMRDARVLRCTPSHKILTPIGYVRASDLKVGDKLVVRGRHLTQLQFSMLVGSMLGDGSMGRNKNRNSPQPSFTQGEDQLGWLKFKKSVFGEDMTGGLQKGKSGYGPRATWRFTLNITDQARRVSEQMLHNAKKKNGRQYWSPTDEFLSWVDEAALAFWYADDGALMRRNGRVMGAAIHTECFSKDVNERLSKFLDEKFGLDTIVRNDSKGHWFIGFRQDAANKLLAIVTPFIPECMAWKAPGGNFTPPFVPAGETTVAPIQSIQSVARKTSRDQYVYDLEVKDHHNYVAGNVVVSNCSMVDSKMLARITRHNVRVLAVGDHGQLPPVMGESTLMKTPDLRLEKIHRQTDGSPIIQLSRAIREEHKMDRSLADGKSVVFASANDLRRRLLPEIANTPPLEVAFLCWRNQTRVHINRTVREYFGHAGKPPQKGEPVVCLRNMPEKGVFNGMRGIMTENAVALDDWWVLRAKIEFPDEEIPETEYEICRDQFHRHDTFKSIEELKAIGIDVDTMSGAGKLFDFGYAMTIHKFQGSQVPHAIVQVDWRPDYSKEDTRRLAYTAVTRASERLTVLT